MTEFSFYSFFLSTAVILALLLIVLESGAGGFIPKYTRDIDHEYDDDDDDDDERGRGRYGDGHGDGDGQDSKMAAKKYKTLALSLLDEIEHDRRKEKVDVWKLVEDDLKNEVARFCSSS